MLGSYSTHLIAADELWRGVCYLYYAVYQKLYRNSGPHSLDPYMDWGGGGGGNALVAT